MSFYHLFDSQNNKSRTLKDYINKEYLDLRKK